MNTTVSHGCAPSVRTGFSNLRSFIVAGVALASAMTASGAGSSWSGVPVVQPIMPADVQVPISQFHFNNLAWQQFITLNWAADPNSPGNPDPTVSGSTFGTPGDTTPVVWESYKEASEVFRPNAEPPTPWGAQRALPAAFAKIPGSKGLKATSRAGIKGLFASSKFDGGPELDLSDFAEAFTGGAWLTAQPKMNNYITLFEKRLNEDEYNYPCHRLMIGIRAPSAQTSTGPAIRG